MVGFRLINTGSPSGLAAIKLSRISAILSSFLAIALYHLSYASLGEIL